MLQIKRIGLHHKLQPLIRICFLLDYHLLFLRFLLLLWACVFFLEKISYKKYCCSNPKIPRSAKKYLLKTAAENLKANSKDCASLLTTFLVYYEHVFVYCNVFAATISFSIYLLSILNRSHTLIYFYLLSVLYWVQKKPPEVSFKKRCHLKLCNIFRKTAVLGSLFNKAVGLQDCKY